MSSALTQSELFALLQDGHTVLLPTAHAARTVRARYKQAPASLAPHVEPGPALAWQEWTTSTWSTLVVEGLDERVLLNRAQEDHLWAEIIAAHPATPDTSPETRYAQAQMARSALHLAASYNATDRLRPAADTFDSRTFVSWLDAFRDHCTRNRLLAPAFLEQALARHLRSGSLKPPDALHLAGFDQHTPVQRDLITALHASGCELRNSTLQHAERSETTRYAVTAADPREQLNFAVCWIAQQAKQQIGTFALILPNAEEHRSELERLLRHHVAPELDAISADLSSTPWQFAQGAPLRSYSMVRHALELLRWTQQPLPTERIGNLLLSPYFTFTDSLESRARFEAATLRDRRLLRPELDLAQFQEHARHTSGSNSSQAPRLTEFQSLLRLTEQKGFKQGLRSHADWADQVRSLLSVMGWPGPRLLSPTEFAAAERWDGVLDLLATLDLNGRRLTFQTFLTSLDREVDQTSLFAPQTTAAIQILPLSQTEGVTYDAALLLDASANDLPAPESLNPLIPRRLQTTLRMPGADTASSYQRTREALESLGTRSGMLHLVAPATGSNGPIRYTTLAEDLGFVSKPAEDLLPATRSADSVPLIEAPEPPLPPLPARQVSGGARVLELQAKCGFQAFAELRLHAAVPETPALGLDPRDSGTVLHETLRKFWDSLKEQTTLRHLSTAQRQDAVLKSVTAALQPLRNTPSAQQPWGSAFIGILQARFTRLVLRWLDCELERAPFLTIAQEQERHIPLGPLDLTVRLDRVDQVDNGLVFVDYKTAYALSTDDWLGSRPDAPQLPLYALSENDPGQVRGLAFARVRPGKDMGWLSLYDSPGLFRGKGNKEHPLSEELDRLRQELTRLATAFAEGRVDVDPKSYPGTCKHCVHRLLCRLDPTDLLAQDVDENEMQEEDVLG